MLKINDKYIDAINDLFIMRRDRYLRQLEDGSYITCPNNTSDDNRPLNDIHIKNHLMHKETYGILVSKATKFMMFDIDGNGIENAKHIKKMLINQLDKMGIESWYLHTEFSGKKGYHVYAFFDRLYDVECINRLQKIAIMKVSENKYYNKSWGNIEIRPTPTQGIKLPLGVHQGTKSICWFCGENDVPIESSDYLFTIRKIPESAMNAVFAKIKLDNNTDFALSRVIKGETGTGSGISKETYLTGKEAFENGISWPHERHNLLFSAALYLKFKGMSYEQCSKALSDWMNEQDETVITTPKSRWQEDVDRVVKDVYSGRYVNDNTGRNVSVRVTRNLLGYIYKNTNTKVQRVILLLMAVNHMKFTDHLEDGGFRFSTSQIQTDTEVSWDSAKKVPLQLADMGLIKRETGKTSKNPIVKAASLFGKPPTWYKVNDDLANLIHETISAKASAIEISDDKPLYGQMNYALHSLFEEYELKEMLKKDAYKTSDRDYKDFCLRYKTW